jgi:hypothetical protein
MKRVEIRVKGHIDSTWSEWLDGMTITHAGDDESVLVGPVIDQPALYGLLTKLRDMGLALVSVASADVMEELRNEPEASDLSH